MLKNIAPNCYNMEQKEQFSIVPSEYDALDVTPMTLLVYCNIRRFMDKDTKIAFPSTQRIAELCEIAKPTVLQHIKILEEKGYF